MNAMTDRLELFVTPAKSISIGGNASVEISSVEVNDCALHCNVVSTQISVDQYGDQIVKLSMNLVSDAGFPIQKLRLKFPSGEVGFDSVATPREVIFALLQGSYLATDKPDKLIPFLEFVGAVPIDLMQFFKNKGALPIIVTYHKPKPTLWSFFESNQFVISDATENLQILMHSLQHCDAAMVWSWAYGLNPSVFSVKSSAFIFQLKTSLAANSVQVRFISDESQLREW